MFDRDYAKLANSTYVYIYSYKKKPGNTFRFHTLAKNAFVLRDSETTFYGGSL